MDWGRTQLLRKGSLVKLHVNVITTILPLELLICLKGQSWHPNNWQGGCYLQSVVIFGGLVPHWEAYMLLHLLLTVGCQSFHCFLVLVFHSSFWILSRVLPGLGSRRLLTLEVIARGFLEHYLPTQVSQPCLEPAGDIHLSVSDPGWRAVDSVEPWGTSVRHCSG